MAGSTKLRLLESAITFLRRVLKKQNEKQEKMDKYLIVGLGNPGAEYDQTRHNTGFMVLDAFANAVGTTFDDRRYGFVAETSLKGRKLFLLKPTTYMNLSGVAVGAYANFYHIDPDDIAVIQDDMDMPVGQLRIRRKGSAGGHNGIKSITEHLGTDAYPRFKIGIGHPARNNKAVVNHVLHAFQGEDKTAIEAAVAEMATALEEWIKSGDIEEVMQAHNKKKAKAEKPAAE